MDKIKKSDIPCTVNGSENWRQVFGSAAYIKSDDASMAYCHYDAGLSEKKYGQGEIYYVSDCSEASVVLAQGSVETDYALKTGLVLYMQKGDAFSFRVADGGHLDMTMFCPKPEFKK